MIYQGKDKTPVREIVLHCAAIPSGAFDHMTPFQAFATIDRWHVERGFRHGFGYHWLMMPDGTLYTGRPPEMIGAHVIGHNRGTLGVCLIESVKIKEMGRFADYFTEAQDIRLRFLLQALAQKGVRNVSGHNDYAKKLCPGFKVSEWF